ncbi:ARM repeat-containing protein [Basidiobolus meristosporus CBS 931.73]|uniref:ARM repeat-containing protein n=1 Tax=Basidiobolus meristosporus CBS 931.73 TaxID=1314790 RepID=A0A1Y1X769_9FUNG|nr:ARM repeat-containing protein [Basidiobolus meristosporus CBS 931.73]|eukprot:ORX81575.1 ARM repeat-containing protein [Basidiobolus meristosporus CBS 931.73]
MATELALDEGEVQTLTFFKEAEQFKNSLEELISICRKNGQIPVGDIDSKREKCLTIELSKILEQYQEQPHLLDPHLESIVNPLIAELRNKLTSTQIVGDPACESEKVERRNINSHHSLFQILYVLSKVRGYKTIVKFFGHEVADLEQTFYFLLLSSPEHTESWETRYVLLIWLSLIVMIPFDLQTIDSGFNKELSLIEHLIQVAKGYLALCSKESDAAAVLLSRLLSRRDCIAKQLPEFFQWAHDQLFASSNVFLIKGILLALSAILKQGNRESILPHLSLITPCIHLLDSKEGLKNNTLIRKLIYKLTQRIGLCCLKPRVANWRYQRGNRSLKQNLASTAALSGETEHLKRENREDADDDDDEEEEEYPEELEEIIDILLNGLKDKDTICRWSVAKGLGRISGRLPRYLADDIIGSIIELFDEDLLMSDNQIDLSGVSDHTWHGACLSIAELARRGLLLPDRLEQTIPKILLALKFDQKRGSHSIGAHVRDAACYVCWSFARAYAPEVLKPLANDLANSLAAVCVFDREVNVRRASSAAFQENVGRQISFPHGISILTAADYFSVGNRTNSFLNVSVEIARYPEYRAHLIDHVAMVTLNHWDKAMRQLGSKALYRLTEIDPDYVVESTIPTLVASAKSFDMNIRHGAVLGLGEVCLAWSQSQKFDDEWAKRHADLIEVVGGVVSSFPRNALETFGSEQTREAACRYIACLSQAKWPLSEEVLHQWRDIVYSSLERKEEWLQEEAAKASKSLVACYGLTSDDLKIYPLFLSIFFSESLTPLLTMIAKIEPAANALGRRGYSLALGSFDYIAMKENIEDVCEALVNMTQIQENPALNDTEARRNAMLALTNIVNGLQLNLKEVISLEWFNNIVSAFLSGLEDYSVDSRGDIGSWVREASMKGLKTIGSLAALLDNTSEPYITREISTRIISGLLKQCVERIDRIRACAGECLHHLLHGGELAQIPVPGIPFVANREVMEEAIPKDIKLNWYSAMSIYPRMVQVLVIPEYHLDLLTGFIVSAGGLTESLVRHSSTSLVEYISELPVHADSDMLTLQKLSRSLTTIMDTYAKQDRVIVPLLEVLDMLFERETLQQLEDLADTNFLAVYERVRKEAFKCRDIRKLSATIKVMTGLSSLHGAVRVRALQQLLGYLVHPFPKIRRLAADQLYLMQASQEEENEEIEEILVGTDWDQSPAQLKEIRNQLYPLLQIPQPVLVKPKPLNH